MWIKSGSDNSTIPKFSNQTTSYDWSFSSDQFLTKYNNKHGFCIWKLNRSGRVEKNPGQTVSFFILFFCFLSLPLNGEHLYLACTGRRLNYQARCSNPANWMTKSLTNQRHYHQTLNVKGWIGTHLDLTSAVLLNPTLVVMCIN
jgi:hypothetical protein